MLLSVFGGLGLFLLGLEQLTQSMRVIAGDRLKAVLARVTSSRILGVAAGAGLTAVIQSSSVTTVLVVGFVSAGLMSLSQSVGVIMGANIGTTITAQVIAFKVTKIALPLVGFGFATWFLVKQERIKQLGGAVLALGLIFLGMNVMSEAMSPLRSYAPFHELMASMSNPLVGLAVAAAFTGLVQSSSATTGVVIAMATQGLITIEAGIALTLGANVGTCVTAGLAAIGKPREAQRVALVHMVFNVVGALVWVGLISQLSGLAQSISTDSVPRQIANAHTIFNISNTILLLPFAGVMARFVERVVPDEPLGKATARQRAFDLPSILLVAPDLALAAVRREIDRMGSGVLRMLEGVMPAVFDGSAEKLDEVEKMDAEIDAHHAAIISYLGRLSTEPLSSRESREVTMLMSVANDLENIGDIVETNLVNTGRSLVESGVTISPTTQEVLGELHALAIIATQQAVQSVVEDDAAIGRAVVDMKPMVNELTKAAALHEASRLVADEPNRLAAYTNEVDIIERLKRIYSFAKRIGRRVAATA